MKKIDPYYHFEEGRRLEFAGKKKEALEHAKILIDNDFFLYASRIFMKTNKELAELYGEMALQKYRKTKSQYFLVEAGEIFSELEKKEKVREIANALYCIEDYCFAGIYYADAGDFQYAIKCLKELEKRGKIREYGLLFQILKAHANRRGMINELEKKLLS